MMAVELVGHLAGDVSIELVATSVEELNGDTAINSTRVLLEVEAVADAPLLVVENTMPVGREDEWLTVVISSVSLVDTDGSEELTLEVRTRDENLVDMRVLDSGSRTSYSYFYDEVLFASGLSAHSLGAQAHRIRTHLLRTPTTETRSGPATRVVRFFQRRAMIFTRW